MNEFQTVSSSTPLYPLLEWYLDHFGRGSSHTAKAKRTDIDALITFLVDYHKTKDLTQLTVAHWSAVSIQQFLEACFCKGEAPSTVSRRLATVKHAGRILAERIPGLTNPAREITPPRMKAPKPKAVGAEELEKIFQKAFERSEDKPSFNRERNRMILITLVSTGLRADEVRLLRMNQLSEEKEWFTKVRTKGKIFRNVYISSSLRSELERYLLIRKAALEKNFGSIYSGLEKKLPLFPSFYKATLEVPDTFLLGAKTLWRAVRELSALTKLHPHLLRHTFAHSLLENSRDIRLVSQALGHSDVRTTMRYTERGEQEVANAIEKALVLPQKKEQ